MSDQISCTCGSTDIEKVIDEADIVSCDELGNPVYRVKKYHLECQSCGETIESSENNRKVSVESNQ